MRPQLEAYVSDMQVLSVGLLGPLRGFREAVRVPQAQSLYILQGRLARSQKAMEHSQQYPPILPGPEHTWVAAQV